MIVGVIAVLALGFIVLHAVSPYQLPLWLQFLSDPAFQALVIILIVFGLIVWFVTKEPSTDKRPAAEKLWEWFRPPKTS
jgi:ascorbate-specific PTS system EIIC-type component UlaA